MYNFFEPGRNSTMKLLFRLRRTLVLKNSYERLAASRLALMFYLQLKACGLLLIVPNVQECDATGDTQRTKSLVNNAV